MAAHSLPYSEQVLVFWCGGSLCPSLPRLLVQLVLATIIHILLTLIPSSLPIILMVAAARDIYIYLTTSQLGMLHFSFFLLLGRLKAVFVNHHICFYCIGPFSSHRLDPLKHGFGSM